MRQEQAFLQAVLEAPEDDTARLIYADWLEERGDPRGEFLRVECQLRSLRPQEPKYESTKVRLGKLRPGMDPDWLALVDRSDRYTMLWPESYCRDQAEAGEVGRPLRFVEGGNSQQDDFSRIKVSVGDYMYPLQVRSRKLYLVARMRVNLVTDIGGYLRLHPEDRRFFARTSYGQVLAGEEGTPIRFDLEVPREIIERLSFRSRKQERRLRHVVNGELRSWVEVQGVFRLTRQSARDLDMLLSKVRRVERKRTVT